MKWKNNNFFLKMSKNFELICIFMTKSYGSKMIKELELKALKIFLKIKELLESPSPSLATNNTCCSCAS
jgi:hypothetical protein